MRHASDRVQWPCKINLQPGDSSEVYRPAWAQCLTQPLSQSTTRSTLHILKAMLGVDSSCCHTAPDMGVPTISILAHFHTPHSFAACTQLVHLPCAPCYRDPALPSPMMTLPCLVPLTHPCPMFLPALRKNLMVALARGSVDDRISCSTTCTADSISLLSTCRT